MTLKARYFRARKHTKHNKFTIYILICLEKKSLLVGMMCSRLLATPMSVKGYIAPTETLFATELYFTTVLLALSQLKTNGNTFITAHSSSTSMTKISDEELKSRILRQTVCVFMHDKLICKENVTTFLSFYFLWVLSVQNVVYRTL